VVTTLATLRNKFRQSKDYTMQMLIRDLIEFADEIDQRFEALETFKAAAEESGSWTPRLEFAGGSVGMTYSTQRGSWLKIGKLVFIDFEFTLTSKGTSVGTANLDGLPFPAASTRPAALTVGYSQNMALPTSTPAILGYGDQSGNALVLRVHNTGSDTTLTDTHFTNTSRWIGAGTYLAA
jgi:hypothetical protein